MKKVFKKLLIFINIFLFCFVFFGIKTGALTTAITVVWSNPAEDSSSAMSFSWQCTDPTSKFEICLKTDPDFTGARVFNLQGVKSENFPTYSFKLTVDDLICDTTYKYQISSGTVTTPVYEVTTAGVAGEFKFVWMSDIHAHPGYTDRTTKANALMKIIDEDSNNECKMILFTGDEVSNGGNFETFKTLTDLKNMPAFQTKMWANIPGNHTYYAASESSMVGNKFYEDVTNHPDNGYDPLSSSYWFMYNSVLFVGLDAETLRMSTTKQSDQQAWFSRVVEANEGRYQYLIVFQHDPWLNALTGALKSGYGSHYGTWHEVFDKYDVDLALAGDYHTYYRSNKLYNGEIVDLDYEHGTVYMGARQIGGRAGGSYGIKDNQNPEYFACRLDNTTSSTSGGGYFTVNASGITWKMFDHDTKKVVDSCFIPARRAINWENKKAKVAETTFFTASSTNGYVNFDSTYKGYVKTLEVKDEAGQLLAKVTPAKDNTSTAILTNLNKNAAYKFVCTMHYADDTSKTFEIYGNTYGDVGEIYGFDIHGKTARYSCEFSYRLKNDLITKFEIYQDETLLETINVTQKVGSFDKILENSVLNYNSVFSLIGKDSNGDIVFTKTKRYNFSGDINLDGVFSSEDLDKGFEMFKNGEVAGEYFLEQNDFNGDRTFDIGDLIMMYQNLHDGKRTMRDNVYTVIYLDFYGNIVSRQRVQEGRNSLEPAIEDINGYKFVYFSQSNKYITSDAVIKAVYEPIN